MITLKEHLMRLLLEEEGIDLEDKNYEAVCLEFETFQVHINVYPNFSVPHSVGEAVEPTRAAIQYVPTVEPNIRNAFETARAHMNNQIIQTITPVTIEPLRPVDVVEDVITDRF